MKRLEFKGFSIETGDEFYAVSEPTAEPTGDFYFLSNDVLTLQLDGKRKLCDVVLCGVANPHFLHVISLVSGVAGLKRVIAVDSNFDQLLHFRRLLDLIVSCNSRIEFLQRLFKVTFNSKAIRILEGLPSSKTHVVRGGLDQDPFFALELEVWQNLTFNAEAFEESYGIKAVVGAGGLIINSRTVGDIHTYFATFFCCSRSDYEHWPFTAAFGSGFLRDQDSYLRTQEVLRQSPLYLLHGDLAELYPDLLNSNRYHPLVVWCSNLLCDYFVAKHPKIGEIEQLSTRLGTQVEPQFPELDLVLLQDDRSCRPLAESIDNKRKRRRRWSVHTKNFSVVSRYLRGRRNLEVIGMRRWFDQDSGVSKLPNTSYCMFEDFTAAVSAGERYDSILLHSISGHCASTDQYKEVLAAARQATDNLIILEHNRLSRDFIGKGIGVTVDEVRDILGAESILDYGPGERCCDRNLILVYRN